MTKKTNSWLLAIFTFGLLSTFSCSHFYKKACCGKKRSAVGGKAIVTAIDGSSIKGTVLFEPTGRHKFKVSAQFEGLKPNQKWGFHVHEFGICEKKALLAGAHFNPNGQKHGGPRGKKRHLGDLGNLSSNSEGVATYTLLTTGKLKKFLGRSVIVHAQPDDLKSQPTGQSGQRLACGVIRAVPPFSTKTSAPYKRRFEDYTRTRRRNVIPATIEPSKIIKASEVAVSPTTPTKEEESKKEAPSPELSPTEAEGEAPSPAPSPSQAEGTTPPATTN